MFVFLLDDDLFAKASNAIFFQQDVPLIFITYIVSGFLKYFSLCIFLKF